ncbi:pyridoxamine 5'-phosphate oxidase family protein [Hyphomicrobium sp. 99]|uniref:pyridoxamine 5'-phosphate oxidase family protein n=1 Tax=Hyphomicrobium sp. 99 TaxID=1163419 RepID=UPI0005F7F67D|nr:pyridoxamine 5'-phosphate oxidase family protein [Hyphomicrobium sp. 99]
MTPSEQKKHLYDLLTGFSTAMLASRTPDNSLHARPMAVAELKPDADAYFVTDGRSPKVAEIEAHPEVLVTFQSSSEFATLYGTASVVRDGAVVERVWNEAWRVWFPGGKDDPNLVLIHVLPKSAEYWDNSSAEGIKYLFEGLKAYLKGERPHPDDTINAKVTLRS